MKKFFQSKWFYAILALIFTFALFFYVHDGKNDMGLTNSTSSSTNTTQMAANKSKDLSVPLQLNVNSDKYFVIGYPEKVNVQLSGPSALVTTTANTQNFKVYADLGNLGPGEHTVKLQQQGLNSDIHSKIKPSKIHVNIQPRRTVKFPVKATYDKKNIASGYKVGKASSDVSSAKVTGPIDQINRIDSVVAKISLKPNTKSDVKQDAVIEALDKKGKTINVIITPSTSSVDLPVSAGDNKRVPVKVNLNNKQDDKTYDVKCDPSDVLLLGDKNAISGINSVNADVDVSKMSGKNTKTVSLDTGNSKVSGLDPSTVKVQVDVKDK
ncbi:CdaR family protein [Fructilactobacillus fructivorans]|uniref:CdaR family protein n=1 Tax=Fructilactobacillus fructivorans TaxID=1614 RepID=UPI00070564D0|nr:CdaR family protein [Fructilactobacillus fructivorans]KRN43194.1 hypothetical protein IV48_GL000749 [Fructilactobacillus fructivorans]